MAINRSTTWSLSLGICFLLWIFFPAARLVLSALFIVHTGILARGIFDIRRGFFCNVYCRNAHGKGAVALTFDDGPDPRITGDILDLLDTFGMRATFFVVAAAAQRHPGLVRDCIGRGNTIGCHDLTHSIFSNFRRSRRLYEEIGRARDAIGTITGRKPLLYRPPMGLTNPHLAAALQAHGMTCIGWSRRAQDHGNRKHRAFAKIPKLAAAGEVILLHDVLPRTEYRNDFLCALRELLESIRSRKLETLTVNDFFGVSAYETN